MDITQIGQLLAAAGVGAVALEILRRIMPTKKEAMDDIAVRTKSLFDEHERIKREYRTEFDRMRTRITDLEKNLHEANNQAQILVSKNFDLEMAVKELKAQLNTKPK